MKQIGIGGDMPLTVLVQMRVSTEKYPCEYPEYFRIHSLLFRVKCDPSCVYATAIDYTMYFVLRPW